MTKQDYELIAKAVRLARSTVVYDPGNGERGLCRIVYELRLLLKKDSENFAEAKFARACGYEY